MSILVNVFLGQDTSAAKPQPKKKRDLTAKNAEYAKKDSMRSEYLAQRRKGAKIKKFEARNPKAAPRIETILNDQNMKNSKQASFGFGVLDFPDLRFICL